MRMHVYNEKSEQDYRTQAELIRHQTTLLINIQLDKKNKITAQKLWPLPWDKKEKAPVVDTAPNNIQQLISVVNGKRKHDNE